MQRTTGIKKLDKESDKEFISEGEGAGAEIVSRIFLDIGLR